MNVLYLTETKSLRVLPLETVLDEMLNDGATPGNLKYLAQNLDAQGFDIGKIDGISYAVIKLNLPESNILILSDKELEGLFGCIANAGTDNLQVLDAIEAKIDDLIAPKSKDKLAYKSAKDYSHI